MKIQSGPLTAYPTSLVKENNSKKVFEFKAFNPDHKQHMKLILSKIFTFCPTSMKEN